MILIDVKKLRYKCKVNLDTLRGRTARERKNQRNKVKLGVSDLMYEKKWNKKETKQKQRAYSLKDSAKGRTSVSKTKSNNQSEYERDGGKHREIFKTKKYYKK